MNSSKINESEQNITKLTTQYQSDISIIEDAAIRKQRQENYNAQNQMLKDELIKAKKEITKNNTRRDSLIQAYETDSIRLDNIKLRNKLKIKK